MKRRSIIFCLMFAAGLLSAPHAAFSQSTAPRAVVPSLSHDFGTVKQGQTAVHGFVVRNEGTVALEIGRVDISLRGIKLRVPRLIPPGEERRVIFEWDTAKVAGEMLVEATLQLNDPLLSQVTLVLRAVVTPPIDVVPFPAFFLRAFVGEGAQESVTVVNTQEQPVAITRLEPVGDFFVADLRTAEAGKSYELVVTVPREARLGRHRGSVVLHTDDPAHPRVTVPVNLIVRPELYASPGGVGFGRVSLARLTQQPSRLALLAKTVLVKKRKGDFAITAIETDVPFIDIKQDPEGRSQVFKIEVGFALARAAAGEIDGVIRIRTDDPAFPELVVPLRGLVVDDR